LKLLPLLVKVAPSGRLLNAPAIGVAAVLLMTVKTVPAEETSVTFEKANVPGLDSSV